MGCTDLLATSARARRRDSPPTNPMPTSIQSLRPLAHTLPPGSPRRFGLAVVSVIAALTAVPAVAAVSITAGGTLPSAAIAKPKHTGGHVVRWSRGDVTLSVADSMKSVARDHVAAVGSGLAAWVGACSGLPALRVAAVEGEELPIGPDGVNVVRLAPAEFAMPMHALAVTVVTFSADSGEIVDADMLIDARGHELAELDEGTDHHGAYDVQSLVTHEVGHVLGLGEDYDDEHAAMYAWASAGDTSKRALTPSDRAALGPLYDAAPASRGAGAGCSAGNRGAGSGLLALAVAAVLASSRRLRRATVSLAVAWLLAGEASSSASADEAYVSSTATEWRGGVMVTTVELRDEAGGSLGSVSTLGGVVGNLCQVASGAFVPVPGARISRAALRRSAIAERAQ